MSSLVSLFTGSKKAPKPDPAPSPAKAAAGEPALKAREAKRRAGASGYQGTFYAGKEKLG